MEDFIPYELAVKLKEKGFKEDCLCHYINSDIVYNLESTIANNQMWFCHNKYDNIWHRDNVDAPTISQVLKWLREEKEIFIRVTLSYDYSTNADGEQVDRWTFWLFEVFSVGSGSLIYTEEISEYDSYELAALAGVEYVIDNLI